jgi:hypothetical protein
MELTRSRPRRLSRPRVLTRINGRTIFLIAANEIGWEVDRFGPQLAVGLLDLWRQGGVLGWRDGLLVRRTLDFSCQLPLRILHTNRIGRGAAARQELIGRFRDDDATRASFESAHEAQIACRTEYFVPRQPDAVRWAHVRIAEVLLQLVRGKDEFLLGPLLRRIVVVGIKRVHDQRPVDFDRFGIIFAVEEDPTAETTHGRLPRLVQNGIRPEGHNACRRG